MEADSVMDLYDGTGHSVTIPTLLIDKEYADKLKALFVDPEKFYSDIILKADIEISSLKSQSISYTLFYGSVLDLDTEFIE